MHQLKLLSTFCVYFIFSCELPVPKGEVGTYSSQVTEPELIPRAKQGRSEFSSHTFGRGASTDQSAKKWANRDVMGVSRIM